MDIIRTNEKISPQKLSSPQSRWIRWCWKSILKGFLRQDSQSWRQYRGGSDILQRRFYTEGRFWNVYRRSQTSPTGRGIAHHHAASLATCIIEWILSTKTNWSSNGSSCCQSCLESLANQLRSHYHFCLIEKKLSRQINGYHDFTIDILISLDFYYSLVGDHLIWGCGPVSVESQLGNLIAIPTPNNTETQAS